ncbi:hypothetical protein M9H77_00220 [Catharanthus roseus]|nr:hypothetical protein M9H77_00220 [Catharanthus roseus]
MAPSCSSRKKGKKKVSVESVDVVGVDRISNLPDSILCFILSFLPKLHSIRTSLLSKGGNFFGLKFPLFVSMLGRIEIIVSGIFIHHNAPSLDILYLHMEGKISKLSLWIKVPENLYICETLESLKFYYLQVMIGGGVHLSRLHTLVLYLVTFGVEECFHKIVDGCPKLESLCFIKIFDDWDFMPTILVSSRTLKKFDMTFSSYYKQMVFEIRAPSLEYLIYIDLNDVYTAKEAGEISYSNSITKLYFGNATTPLPQLTRLSKLAIKVICCQWNNILFLLESSVNLEVLILQKVSQTLYSNFQSTKFCSFLAINFVILEELSK